MAHRVSEKELRSIIREAVRRRLNEAPGDYAVTTAQADLAHAIVTSVVEVVDKNRDSIAEDIASMASPDDVFLPARYEDVSAWVDAVAERVSKQLHFALQDTISTIADGVLNQLMSSQRG